LRWRHEGLEGDPGVRALLRDVLDAVDPEGLNGMDAKQEAIGLALIQTIFRQALELLEHPERKPGWTHRDPVILQSQGQVLRMIVHSIGALAARRPELNALLQQPGVLLDVGTGVGWLAIEAASCWSALRVVGIDPWEPALALARENLAKSEVAERVEFHLRRVEDLDEAENFALVWLPGPFIAAEIADRALERLHRALAPGGWLIFGLNGQAPGPVEEALARLRIVRSGGHPWTRGEVEERLRIRFRKRRGGLRGAFGFVCGGPTQDPVSILHTDRSWLNLTFSGLQWTRSAASMLLF
jgi:SAM-dependent methyltransferase